MVWKKISLKKPGLLVKTGEWINKVRQDRNVIIFLIFLVISTGFWFLNALRKNYVATLSYPVRLVNIPENKMLPEDFKPQIEIKVRAGGYVILRYQLSNTFLPLSMDISEMDASRAGQSQGVFAVMNEEQNRIVAQLSQGMELIEVSPDTLFVPLLERAVTRVPLTPVSRLSFRKQHMQSGPVLLDPDSVEISGPKQIIDTIKFIKTREMVFDDLADSLSVVVPLVLPKRVHSSVRRVMATIPVEPFTELNVRVPLRVTGLPDSLSLKTFPSEIQVSFRIGISKYEHVDKNGFRAQVDASPVLTDDRPERLKVKLERRPANVESVSFSPIFVEYLLEKRR